MATISDKHQFIAEIELKPINPKYETRPHIEGSWFLFFGGIRTVYKEEMVSCDGHEEVCFCGKCGKKYEDPVHNLVMSMDRIDPL